MSSRWWTRACAAGLAIALAACGGDDDVEPGAETAPPSDVPTPALSATFAWEEPSSAPVLSVSANDATVLELHLGWPLIVTAVVLHPEAFAPAGAAVEPLALSGGDALRLRVVNEAGEDQSWSLHPATSLPAELALAHDGFAEAAWWLAGDETAALPEGRYTLVAELDTERATSGWQGRAVSPPVELALSAEPSPLAPELARAKRHLGLSLLLLRGEREAAETEVESLLREDPDDLSALEIRGDLLAESGREDEALAAYGRALELFSELSPDSPEPPDTLLAKRHALLTRRLMPE